MPVSTINPLSFRPRWPIDALRLYYLLSGGMSVCYTLVFTVNLVYQATVVNLSPLQLVLVGTVLEATVFLFEVPTGIVADLYSRRLSIMVGLILVGGGFLLEGSMPAFAAVLGAQVLWGIGYTFTSGAIEAWATDEIDTAQMAPIFLRGGQVAMAGGFVATIVSAGLGVIAIQIPIVLAGAGFIVIAAALALTMTETRFHRVPDDERTTFGQMAGTFREGLALARSRPVVRSLLLASLVIGLASEAFDRLWIVHLIDSFTFPPLLGTREPVVWFAAIGLVGTAISYVTAELVRRVFPGALAHLHPTRLMTGLAAVHVLAVAVFATTDLFWVALAALWTRDAGRAVSGPVSVGWMNRSLDNRTRATVLSMQGQCDAIGQVVGGPVLGGVGNLVSVRAALIASALTFSPVIALYARMRTSGKEDVAKS